MASFRHVDRKSLAATPAQLILALVLSAAVSILLSRTYYSEPVAFNWYSIREGWSWLALFLLIGWLATRYAKQKITVLSVVIVFYLATTAMELVTGAAYHAVVYALKLKDTHPLSSFIYFVFFVWLIAAVIVLMRHTGKLARRHALLVVLPIIVLWIYDEAMPPAPMWYSTSSREEMKASTAGRDSAVKEELLHLQPRLMQQTLAALLPNRKVVADLYFIGFAPYGHEDVFLKESEVIRTLMDQRFDTAGRSLLLVNNDKALRRYPLATVTNLRETLNRVGKLINKEQDVLVLYVTSHGSDKHVLSSRYWPLRLDELNPTLLKQVLDDSGIKWRVVVISACYAGGFIEPLRGPTTLVMTAADAKTTSFGCGNESDFTYFAKALFDEQLRQTYSFEKAFRRAVPLIRAREKSLREEFSNPQIVVGDAIRAKLDAVERRLQNAPRR